MTPSPTAALRPPRIAASLLLLAAALTSCSGEPTGRSAPAVVQVLSGDNQEGTVETDLANPLVVEVLDASGKAVSAAEVTWSVASGAGAVSPAKSTTNDNGLARTFLRLGPTAGDVVVHARVGALDPVAFGARARPRPPARIEVTSGDRQSGTAGTALPHPVRVRVLDSRGAPVAGATVTFTPSTGWGVVDPGVASTADDGIAATKWVLGHVGGTQTLTASIEGLTPVTFTATAAAVAFRKLSVAAGSGQTAPVMTLLPEAVLVRLVDSAEAPVAGALVSFAPTHGGEATENLVTTDANGFASTVWRLGTFAGTQALAVSAPGVTFQIAVSATATVGPASRLSISSGNYQAGEPGQPLAHPVVVRVTDAWENPVPGSTVTFATTMGGGAISPSSVSTGPDGRAGATWTLGPLNGANGATATAAGIGEAAFAAIGMVMPAIHPLPFRVVDAEYSRATGRIVAVSANPSRLHIIDAETRAVQSVDLAYVPTSVAVQADGLFAAVAHDVHISYVDLTTAAVQRVYTVSTPVTDVLLPGNGYLYALPLGSTWGAIHTLTLESGAETKTHNSVYPGTRWRLHPSGKYIYTADNGISPSDFQKVDIRAGPAALMYDSPYHGQYEFGGDLWIADDGLRLFARSGNVFRSSELRLEDMIYAGKLAGMSRLQWAEQSTPAGRIFALPAAPSLMTPPASELRVYETEYLGFRGTVPLPSFVVPDVGPFPAYGRFVFANAAGTRLHVLLQADGASGVAQDWGIVTYAIPELP